MSSFSDFASPAHAPNVIVGWVGSSWALWSAIVANNNTVVVGEQAAQEHELPGAWVRCTSTTPPRPDARAMCPQHCQEKEWVAIVRSRCRHKAPTACIPNERRWLASCGLGAFSGPGSRMRLISMMARRPLHTVNFKIETFLPPPCRRRCQALLQRKA